LGYRSDSMIKKKEGIPKILAKAFAWICDRASETDLPLLAFLLLFLNIKLPVKIFGILLIYVLRFNFKFGINLRGSSRLPLFYCLITALALIQLLILGIFQSNYLLLWSVSVGIWGICFLASHQMKLAVEKNSVAKIKNALKAFFCINFIFSIWNLVALMLETGSINPYTYEGMSYRYFTSTGDYIRGVTFDVCTTNMLINAFGLFYFLYQRNYIFSAFCMLVVLMTTSNLGNIILVLFFLYLFVFDRNRHHKTVMITFFAALVVFMVKVTPANLDYFTGSAKKMGTKKKVMVPMSSGPWKMNSDSLLRVYISMHMKKQKHDRTAEEKKIRQSLDVIRDKINVWRPEKRTKDTAFSTEEYNMHQKMLAFSRHTYGDSIGAADLRADARFLRLPGKAISFVQTGRYMRSGISPFFIGAGPGNFSSKMGFRALGLNTNGNWPRGKEYASQEFKDNHLKLWLFYQVQAPSEHSIINSPNSVFNQLCGEYGSVGLALFVVFYLWFFLKRYKMLTYGKILIPLFVAFLCTDYWFENMSVVPLFELLLFLDMKKEPQISHEPA
jgi:hypothetical protein